MLYIQTKLPVEYIILEVNARSFWTRNGWKITLREVDIAFVFVFLPVVFNQQVIKYMSYLGMRRWILHSVHFVYFQSLK